MAKRTPYRAAIIGDGLADEQTTTYAMNSAIRATETLVRALAHSEGVMYHGDRPERTRTPNGISDVYTRVWTGDNGQVITAQAHRWGISPESVSAGAQDVDPLTRDPYAYPDGYDALTDDHGNPLPA